MVRTVPICIENEEDIIDEMIPCGYPSGKIDFFPPAAALHYFLILWRK